MQFELPGWGVCPTLLCVKDRIVQEKFISKKGV